MSTSRFTLPWLSNELRKKIDKKNKLYTKAKTKNNVADWESYLKLKHLVQKETRKTHWDYEGQILQDSLDNKETKTFWKYIKSKKQEKWVFNL